MYFIKILPLILFFSCGNIWWGNFAVTDASLTDKVEITFSSPPSHETLENAFSLHCGGEKISGELTVEGSKVIFFPAKKFSSLEEYLLNITTLAENTAGISLEENYSKIFNKKSHEPLKIIDFYPKNESTMNTTDFPISITFDSPIDEKNFTEAFSIKPKIDCIFNFSSDKTQVTILPTEEFSRKETYIVEISDTLHFADKKYLEKKLSFFFTFTEDFSPPNFSLFLIENNEKKNLEENNNFATLPQKGIIQMEFSKEINIDELPSHIQIRPEIDKKIIVDSRDKTKAQLEFPQGLSWNENYILTLKKGISDIWGNSTTQDKHYFFIANDENDRPLEFLGVALDCGENPQGDLAFFSSQDGFSTVFFNINRFIPAQTVETGVASKVFFFFSGSKLHEISLKSVMENIDVQSTNSCIDFSLRKIRITEDFPIADKVFENVEGKITAVEFTCETRNQNRNGLIKFKIYENLCDEVGNSIKSDMEFVLNKKNEA